MVRNSKVQINFFLRKKRVFGNFSLEIYFKNIIQELSSEGYDVKLIELPFVSSGIINRLLNIFFVFFHQGELNHITGDINYIALLLNKKKTIVTIPDCDRLNHLSGFKAIIYSLFWIKMPINKSVAVCTISNYSKNEILKYSNCNFEKIKVIPISLNKIFQFNYKSFNEEYPIILQIGTQLNKNLFRTIEAIQGIPCKFIIIGKLNKPIYSKLIESKIDFENYYNLTDQEVFDNYCKCDLVTFISTNEGFGVPIIEANAVGRVIITSNISSMPEVANNSALLVDCFSVENMRLGILKIIKDRELREKLISNGFDNAKRYNNSTITSSYIKLYQEILSKN